MAMSAWFWGVLSQYIPEKSTQKLQEAENKTKQKVLTYLPTKKNFFKVWTNNPNTLAIHASLSKSAIKRLYWRRAKK